jgi:hypothetical protein
MLPVTIALSFIPVGQPIQNVHAASLQEPDGMRSDVRFPPIADLGRVRSQVECLTSGLRFGPNVRSRPKAEMPGIRRSFVGSAIRRSER